MTIKKSKLLCLCNLVSEKEILSVLKRGARNLEEVQKITLATTGCGRCKGEIEATINHYFSSKAPDLQQNIDF